MVTLQPQINREVHGCGHHRRLVIPVVRVGELDELDVGHGHAVHPEHELDTLVLLNAPPIVLDLVHALGKADLLPFQVGHPEDVVLGAHHHDAAFGRHLRDAQQPGPADVRLNLDGRKQTAEADEVVEVVDVVRIPVVLGGGTHVGVLHADLLVLLLGQAQSLVHIGRGNERAVGVIDLFPIQLDGVQFGVLERGLFNLLVFR